MNTNLPNKPKPDSAAGTKLFFDSYGTAPLEFAATDIDATTAFFTSRGFTKDAADTTALTILIQAKTEEVPVFQLLDTLSGFDNIQLSEVISKILNSSRSPSSILGFKSPSVVPKNVARNIMP